MLLPSQFCCFHVLRRMSSRNNRPEILSTRLPQVQVICCVINFSFDDVTTYYYCVELSYLYSTHIFQTPSNPLVKALFLVFPLFFYYYYGANSSVAQYFH
ncbi:hypothetical protein S83_056950 [Arachis hypogaea]